MAKRKTHTPKRAWQPMRRVETPTRAGERAQMWKSDRYVVTATYLDDDEMWAGEVHLSIRHADRSKWVHDWRHLQRIKNDICGPEREAMEIYPAESRLVDQANQFHLWVAPEGAVIGVGFVGERVVGGAASAGAVGAAQRELDDDVAPSIGPHPEGHRLITRAKDQ